MWPIYMQGDGAIVLQPAMEEEMEEEKKTYLWRQGSE